MRKQPPARFQEAVDRLADPWIETDIDYVVGIDARGFILGAAIAYKLNKGLVLVRKEGKLPFRTERVSYELEYGSASVEIHVDAVEPGRRVLSVDDLLATGGTAAAAVELVERTGGIVAGLGFVIELTALGGRARLGDHRVVSLIAVEG